MKNKKAKFHEEDGEETNTEQMPPARKKKKKSTTMNPIPFVAKSEETPNQEEKVQAIDVMALLNGGKERDEPNVNMISLFGHVEEEKIGEVCAAMLYCNELNKTLPEEEKEDKKPIDFYVSTFGGSAHDMFALVDVMNVVKDCTEIRTYGIGKIMSAGVPILACGTKGKRYIGRNTRVMIHSVSAGFAGNLPAIINELQETKVIEQLYVKILSENSNLSKKKIRKLLKTKTNVYLTAEQAVELGLADHIIG